MRWVCVCCGLQHGVADAMGGANGKHFCRPVPGHPARRTRLCKQHRLGQPVHGPRRHKFWLHCRCALRNSQLYHTMCCRLSDVSLLTGLSTPACRPPASLDSCLTCTSMNRHQSCSEGIDCPSSQTREKRQKCWFENVPWALGWEVRMCLISLLSPQSFPRPSEAFCFVSINFSWAGGSMDMGPGFHIVVLKEE